MKSYITYCNYLCLAALVGVLVTGGPSQARAFDIGLSGNAHTNDGSIVDVILGVAASATTGVPVCSDVKGTACSPDGSVQKCQSKRGTKLCQTCTNGKWGTAYSGGDCWGKETTAEVSDTTVLDRF
ncbi:MAG: hypothetical protein IPM13_00835 [Phycisphaerales bacterium]|nr:hypothetical protein [Phycisphaerales bacterium]